MFCSGNNKIHGVNLGGWFVLEKWMKPSLFEGLKANDETSFCEELGQDAEKILKKHWETFITEEDFKWLKKVGINTVRIPVGHWIFGDIKPYYGSIEILDWAMQQTKYYGIDVLLDLHAAPGCQNGFDNGGITGVIEWHKNPENIKRSLDIIGRLCDRYKNYDNLWGIELLNEPRWDVPMDILRDYYLNGYDIIRKIAGNDTYVFIHDGFRPFEWNGFMNDNTKYTNVILDTHIYQCFTEEDNKLDGYGHSEKALARRFDIDKIESQLPTVVGEWSLGLNLKDEDKLPLNDFNKTQILRTFASSQLLSYERCHGWFFWSYKVEIDHGNEWKIQWNFKESVKRGLLPDIF